MCCCSHFHVLMSCDLSSVFHLVLDELQYKLYTVKKKSSLWPSIAVGTCHLVELMVLMDWCSEFKCLCFLSDVLVRFSTLFRNDSSRKRVVEGFLNTSIHSFHPLAPLSPKFDRLVQKHEHHNLLEGTETEQHEYKSLNSLKLQGLKGQTPKKC